MKNLTWAVGGMTLGIVYVLLTGMLGVQTLGARAGAVFDLNNDILAITPPSIPVLPIVATALLSGLVFYGIVVGARKRTVGIGVSTVTGFVVAVLSLVIWSFTITSDAAPEGIYAVGIALGWEGWIQQGGTSPAVHVLIVLALGALWSLSLSSSNEGRLRQDAATLTAN